MFLADIGNDGEIICGVFGWGFFLFYFVCLYKVCGNLFPRHVFVARGVFGRGLGVEKSDA